MTVDDPRVPPLFAAYEKRDRPDLGTFWWGRISDAGLADSLREAAHRLLAAGTDSEDLERVLLPILYLYRHAIEQQLKQAIYEGAGLRRARGHDDASLEPAAVKGLLERKIRHNMGSLVATLNAHLDALGGEMLSARTVAMLALIADTDTTGNGFRFPGQLADVHSFDRP